MKIFGIVAGLLFVTKVCAKDAQCSAHSYIGKLKPGVVKTLGYGDEFISDTLLVTSNPGDLNDYEAIEEVQPMFASGRYFWNLDRINQKTLPLDTVMRNASATNDTIVYILDTGINDNHEEFEGRVIENVNVIDDSGTTDDHSHGTHTAGSCCGKTAGASKSLIVNVKCLDNYGGGSSAGVIKAMQWVKNFALKHPTKRHILNLSLGGGFSQFMNDKANEMSDLGFFVVVAAGNSAKDACEVSPASAEKAITVGATNDKDELAYFSNIGRCVNIYAPGRSIVSASNQDNVSFRVKSGTSMASPLVAGVIAAWLDTHEKFHLSNITFQSTLPLLYLKDVVPGCSGEPCKFEGYCRSQWGYCGAGVDFCNEESIWSEKCGPIIPCKKSNLICLDK